MRFVKGCGYARAVEKYGAANEIWGMGGVIERVGQYGRTEDERSESEVASEIGHSQSTEREIVL